MWLHVLSTFHTCVKAAFGERIFPQESFDWMLKAKGRKVEVSLEVLYFDNKQSE